MKKVCSAYFGNCYFEYIGDNLLWCQYCECIELAC